MSKVVTVKNVKIGEGIPKICTPIIGVTKEEIIGEAEHIKGLSVDLVEWRVDYFDGAFDSKLVMQVLTKLKSQLADIPILFTFRTSLEGGEKEIDTLDYKTLYKNVIESGMADLIDLELFRGDHVIKEIIDFAHDKKVHVIVSNHDFEKTPSKEQIIVRLLKMQELGADILKIAVMPNNMNDVLELLEATNELNETYANRPIITMAMGSIGSISRICGEFFGSAVTFGTAGKSSAPGQLSIDELQTTLSILHKNIAD